MSASIEPRIDTTGRSVPLVVAVGMALFAVIVALASAFAGYLIALSALGKTSPLATSAQVATQAEPAIPNVQAMTPVALPDATTAHTLKEARSYLRSGPADAKVQVVLFEDAQCPYCRQLSVGPVKQLLTDYLSTSSVAVTYRHYPFLGDDSTQTALAMECAGKQDRFWPYHDLVFGDATASSGEGLDAHLTRWANTVKLDMNAFVACRADPATLSLVESDLNAGRELRVQGTPTIFINGKRLIGNVPYDYLKSAIDEALRIAR
jgi:protein-disulfide isomerase